MNPRAIGALALVFALTLPGVTTRIYATDEIQYFSYLRSLWFDRDVSFENEYRHFYEAGPGAAPGFYETHLALATETGRRINYGTIGSALLWVPFYAIADGGVILARALGSGIARDGYSHPYVAAVCYGSAFYGFCALLLSWVAAIEITGARRGSTTAAAVCVGVGTPLLFYMYVAPVFAHATSAFCVALFVVTWLRVRRTWSLSGVAWLAASGALMVMVREQDIAYIAGPALDFVIQHARAPRDAKTRGIAAVAAAAVVFGLVFVPQALAYMSLNGRLGPSRLVTRKLYWNSPHAFEILTSPEHGFFLWTPLAVLALGGLVICYVRLWSPGPRAPSPERRAPDLRATSAERTAPSPRALAVALAMMFIAQVYLLGALDSWTSAGAFGQRRFVGATVLFVIGLTALFDAVRSKPARIVGGVLVVLMVWWNLALMSAFGTGLMDRQRLELRRNAYDVFVTVPAMTPDLVYRYLFDRASFYRNRATEGSTR
jgi:hypothetical protein